MNDKQKLAAIGEQLTAMGERMGVQAQPMCMAKRIEELEAQVRVMAGLLRDARPYMDHRGGAGVKGYTQLAKEIDSALAGNLPIQGTPEGWQLVPAKPTPAMRDAMCNGSRKDWPSDELCNVRYAAMLAAAPKLEAK